MQATNVFREQAVPFPKRHVDIRLHAVPVVEVHDPDGLELLPKAVNAANPLLHPHRVPRHVVVHERAAELEVEALGGCVRAQQYVPGAGAKESLHLIA